MTRITVPYKTTLRGKGLQALADRLQALGEEPGVCTAHQQHAVEKGYLLEQVAPVCTPRLTDPKRSPKRPADAEKAKALLGGQ